MVINPKPFQTPHSQRYQRQQVSRAAASEFEPEPAPIEEDSEIIFDEEPQAPLPAQMEETLSLMGVKRHSSQHGWRPTGLDFLTQGYMKSREFYRGIGYDQFAGLYEPFVIPEGMKVKSIAETSTGLTIHFESLPKKIPEPALPKPAPAAQSSPSPSSSPLQSPSPSPSPSLSPSPSASRSGIPESTKMGVSLPAVKFSNPLNPLSVPTAPDALGNFKKESEKFHANPAGYVAEEVLTDVGLLAIGVNPVAGLTAAGIGAGLSEVINYGFTGQHLSPVELTKAGVQSAGFSGVASTVFKGASLIYGTANKSVVALGMRREVVPVFKDVFGGAVAKTSVVSKSTVYYGMKTEIQPVFRSAASKIVPTAGKTAVDASLGGAISYVTSGGDLDETGKNAAIAAAISLGGRAVGKIRPAKTGLGSAKQATETIKPAQKTAGKRTPLKFDTVVEDPYAGLGTEVAKDLRRIKANANDEIYQALHPKDLAVEAEAKYGSKRQAMFSEQDLINSQKKQSSPRTETQELYDLLFPEQAQERIIKTAESRFGSSRAIPEPKIEVQKPKGNNKAGIEKWNRVAEEWLYGKGKKEAYPIDATAERQAFSKFGKQGKKLSDLTELGEIFSNEIGNPKRPTTDRVPAWNKWVIKATMWKELNPAATVDYKLETQMLGKVKGAKPFNSLKMDEAIFSKDTATYKARAAKSDYDFKKLTGEKAELPKPVSEYILPLEKPKPAGTVVQVGNQALIVLEKPTVKTQSAAQIKAKAQARAKAVDVSSVVLGKAKQTTKPAAQSKAKSDVTSVILQGMTQTQPQGQRRQQNNVVSEVLGDLTAVAAKLGRKEKNTQKPREVQRQPDVVAGLTIQVPRLDPKTDQWQDSKTILRELGSQLQIQKQIKEERHKPVWAKKKKLKVKGSVVKKRKYNVGFVGILSGMEQFKQTKPRGIKVRSSVGNVILGRRQQRRKVKRR